MEGGQRRLHAHPPSVLALVRAAAVLGLEREALLEGHPVGRAHGRAAQSNVRLRIGAEGNLRSASVVVARRGDGGCRGRHVGLRNQWGECPGNAGCVSMRTPRRHQPVDWLRISYSIHRLVLSLLPKVERTILKKITPRSSG